MPAEDSWELSPLYRHATTHFFPSPSTLLVSSHQNRIILRRVDDLQIQRTWSLPVPLPPAPPSTNTTSNNKPVRERATDASHRPAPIAPPLPPPDLFTSFAISPVEPHLILVYSNKVATAWVLDPNQDEPPAKLDVGAEGAVAMTWSGAGDTIMAWSANHLRLSLFRVANPSPALHIHHPKHAHPAGYSFRPTDSRYLAVAERHSGRDHIGIYDCQAWRLLRHFTLPTSASDVADLSWSPCGRYIAIWESLTDYILHLYTPDGRLLQTFEPYAQVTARTTPAGEANASSGKERMREERSTEGWVGLGVRTVRWHPSGEWLAVGGWDGKIRILTRVGWIPVAELLCPPKVSSPVRVWKEPFDWIEKTRGKGIVPFDVASLPYNPIPIRPDIARPNPKMGIADLAWSPSGRWLASYNQSYPTTLWMYTFSTPSSVSSPATSFHPRLHSVLVHTASIRSFTWQTGVQPGELLAIGTGVKGFTVWREPERGAEESEVETEGGHGKAEGVGVPAHTPFNPSLVRFSSSGDALLLSDKGTFAVAYPVLDGDETINGEAERTWIGGDDD